MTERGLRYTFDDAWLIDGMRVRLMTAVARELKCCGGRYGGENVEAG